MRRSLAAVAAWQACKEDCYHSQPRRCTKPAPVCSHRLTPCMCFLCRYDADLRTMVEQQSAWQRFEAAKGRGEEGWF